MESLDREFLRGLINAFRKYGFYIFHSKKYRLVSMVLSRVGDKVKQLVKVRPLSASRTYYILEPDSRAFIAGCREGCLRNGLIDEACYIKCKESNLRSVISEVVKALNKLLSEE